MFKQRYYLMDAAGEGGDVGGGAGSVTAPAPALASGAVAAPALVPAPAVPAPSDPGNALAAGATPATPATIPEKYQVKKEDGTLDVEASSLKLAEAYGHLEKRLGTGDVPPKTADDYQIAVPDAFKDTWKPEDDPMLQEFKKDAHAAGLNQKQFDFVMSKYFKMAPDLVMGARKLDVEACNAQLRTEWKTDDQYKAEVGKAHKAAVGYFGADAEAIIAEYGNDPRMVRALAKIGAEMGEDRSINGGGGAGTQAGVDGLMTSEAYNNPRHPDHTRVSKQVSDHFNALAAAAEKAGNAPLM